MGYDYIEEIRRRFGDKIGVGSRFYDVNNYSSTLSHSGDEVLPWHDEMKAEYESNLEDLSRKQAPFVSADDKWGFKRFRNIYETPSSDNLFEKSTSDAVLDSRLRFIREALHGIDIAPLSFTYDNFGYGTLEARGMNGEGISFARRLRGAGDSESLSVGVSGDKRGMTIVNSTSVYSRRHVFDSGYDVIEDNLLSTCDARGFVFENDGLYLFERKLVQKDNHYLPCFEISYYDADTLDFLKGLSADSPEIVVLQNMLNGEGAYFTALKDSLDTCGIVPAEVTSIECSDYDVVNFANAVYQNPELFLAEYKKKSGLTL